MAHGLGRTALLGGWMWRCAARFGSHLVLWGFGVRNMSPELLDQDGDIRHIHHLEPKEVGHENYNTYRL